jgi:phosphatidate cytidylyltransferase
MNSISPATWDRLFNPSGAFDHPVTLWAVVGLAAALALAGAVFPALRAANVIGPETHRDAMTRWRSWLWLVALMLAPVLLGAAWTILAVLVLSLLCYREFARGTGVFREKTIGAVVVLGTLLVNFAALDHWERLFFALGPLTVALVAVATIPQDRPKGYVQRVALGALGFLLFGFSLGYLSLMANLPDYRPLLILILVAVELNDVFAWCCGKAFGRGGLKLLPNTSPGKTVAGAFGAIVLTTVLVATIAHFLFQGTAVDRPAVLISLGILISGLGQLGDLVLSSIKRDVGVKDTGAAIPGHGGLLDRFDSLLLVPPAVFHYLSYHLGPLAGDQPTRIFTGG